MENNELEKLFVHCSASPYHLNFTADDIYMMHCCAKNLGNGLYRFLGFNYSEKLIKNKRLFLPSGKDVRANLINGNGWSKPGYSDMIDRNAKLTNITPYNSDAYVDGFEITNGAKGYNKNSRHIVLIGGWDKNGHKKSKAENGLFEPLEIFTQEMLDQLKVYINMQLEMKPDLEVIGHQKVSSKLCPGFDFDKWYKENI